MQFFIIENIHLYVNLYAKLWHFKQLLMVKSGNHCHLAISIDPTTNPIIEENDD